LRALLTDHGFTISVFIALVITLMFAYVFEASQETMRNPGGPGHPDCGGGIRLAPRFRAPVMMIALTLIHTLLKRASGCGSERETSG